MQSQSTAVFIKNKSSVQMTMAIELKVIRHAVLYSALNCRTMLFMHYAFWALHRHKHQGSWLHIQDLWEWNVKNIIKRKTATDVYERYNLHSSSIEKHQYFSIHSCLRIIHDCWEHRQLVGNAASAKHNANNCRNQLAKSVNNAVKYWSNELLNLTD